MVKGVGSGPGRPSSNPPHADQRQRTFSLGLLYKHEQERHPLRAGYKWVRHLGAKSWISWSKRALEKLHSQCYCERLLPSHMISSSSLRRRLKLSLSGLMTLLWTSLSSADPQILDPWVAAPRRNTAAPHLCTSEVFAIGRLRLFNRGFKRSRKERIVSGGYTYTHSQSSVSLWRIWHVSLFII